MRKKSILVAIPAGLLVLGLVLAGCEHGPAPVGVQTSGIDVTGEYGSISAGNWHLLYDSADGIRIGAAAGDGKVYWEAGSGSAVSKHPSLGNPKNFSDEYGTPLGEAAVILNGEEEPVGLVIQIYPTEIGKLGGSAGVWIGIGEGTASVVQSLSSLNVNEDDESALMSIVSRKADTSKFFHGKK
jgi:hypothetical protein